MTSVVPLNEDVLCRALTATLSSNALERQEAENVLEAAKSSSGIVVVLARIVASSDVDIVVRTSAAVYLKNFLRNAWYSPREDAEASCVSHGLSSAEKDEARQHMYLLFSSLLAEKASPSLIPVRKSIQTAVLFITRSDWTSDNKEALPWIIEGIKQRSDVGTLRAAIITLRYAIGSYGDYGSDHSEELLSILFPLLVDLARDVCNEQCMANAVYAEMLKQTCKLYWSCSRISSLKTEDALKSVETCLELLAYVISADVPNDVIQGCSTDKRETLPQFKAKQFAMRTMHHCLTLYPRSKTSSSGPEETLGRLFMSKWASRLAQQYLMLLHHRISSETVYYVPDTLISMIIQYLSSCIEFSDIYKAIKAHNSFLLFQVCFPSFCYAMEDVEMLKSDPLELIRMRETLFRHVLTDSASDFVGAMVRHRGRDTLKLVISFTYDILVRYQTATAEERQRELNQKKDGALFMLGGIAERLLSRKRDFALERFFKEFVFPELTNTQDPFLRLRACWMYRTFFAPNRIKDRKIEDIGSLVAAFHRVLALCEDPELVIRVEAAATLSVFCYITEEPLRNAIVVELPRIMTLVMNCVTTVHESELVVTTIESLIENFDDFIKSYYVQLVQCLSKAFVDIIDASSDKDDDSNVMFGAYSVLHAITTVICSIGEPQYHEMFSNMSSHLVPLLDVIFSLDGLDYVDDGFHVLAYLARYSTSVSNPVDLWRYYEKMAESVCNTSSAENHATSEPGWGVDYVHRMLPLLKTFIVRDPHRFTTGISVQGKTYKQLFLDMLRMTLSSECDTETHRYGLELIVLLFKGFIGNAPLIDDMMAPCFELLWTYLQSLEAEPNSKTAPASHISFGLRQLGAMILYNANGFLTLLEQANVLHQVLTLLVEKVSSVTSVEGKKVMVLAYAQLIDVWAGRQQASGSLDTQQCVATLITSLSEQLTSYFKAKEKHDALLAEDESSECCTIDSEQDLDDDEDAPSTIPESLLRKIREAQFDDEDDDDDEDYFPFDYLSEGSTDNNSNECSPLDKINVVDVISRVIVQHAPTFVATLGEQHVCQMREFLGAQTQKRQVQPQTMSST